MSMISEQIESLRSEAEYQYEIEDNKVLADTLYQAADTIELLSEKARAVEPKKGKWESSLTAFPYCSECGWMPEEDEMTHGCYNFCPECGADMRKEQSDEAI